MRDASTAPRAYYNTEAEHQLLGVTHLRSNLAQIKADYANMVIARAND